MRDECAGKTQTLLVDQSRCKDCYYCCYFVFFHDYGTFFIYDGREKPKRFYYVFAFMVNSENVWYKTRFANDRRSTREVELAMNKLQSAIVFLMKYKLFLDKIFSGEGLVKLFAKFKIEFQIANNCNEYFLLGPDFMVSFSPGWNFAPPTRLKYFCDYMINRPISIF